MSATFGQRILEWLHTLAGRIEMTAVAGEGCLPVDSMVAPGRHIPMSWSKRPAVVQCGLIAFWMWSYARAFGETSRRVFLWFLPFFPPP